MTRPTRVEIDTEALRHNAEFVREKARDKAVIAMVKADAYGCGIANAVPVFSPLVDAFGVACLEEARVVSQHTDKPCILFQGFFMPEELAEIAAKQYELVIHEVHQLHDLLQAKLEAPVRVWVKVDTGMHRLGFAPGEVSGIVESLKQSANVRDKIGIMTHLASAHKPDSPQTLAQLKSFAGLDLPAGDYTYSTGNSAAILSMPDALYDVVRPGIMLYGVSPFGTPHAKEIGLKPAMRFLSQISAIHDFEPGARVGYSGTWEAERPSRIAVVACGYGDGYPRHVAPGTHVYVQGALVPIVGIISMDTMTIDITDHPEIGLGETVELWGEHLPVEDVAKKAGTIGYELIAQISHRARAHTVKI